MKHPSGILLPLLIIAIIALICCVLHSVFYGCLCPWTNLQKRTLRNFGKAARSYAKEKENFGYWENGTVKFGAYFDHNPVMGGYHYYYFSDDTNGNSEGEANRYVYIAVPIPSVGRNAAHFVDEDGNYFLADGLEQQQIKELYEQSLKGFQVKLISGAENPSRCDTQNVKFKLQCQFR